MNKLVTKKEEESDGCRRKGATASMQQCDHSEKSFKCLNKHLPRCKVKTVDEKSDEESYDKSDEESDVCHRNEKSDVKEQCPHCLKSFKRLIMHEPKCKLKNVERKSDEFRRIAIESELDKRLRKANVNPRQPDRSTYHTIDKIKEIMLKKLNATIDEGPSLCWKAFSSGSYYEILKIDRPDEFDLMFTCKLDCDINYDPEPDQKHGQRVSQMYCALKPKEEQVPPVLVGNDGWLCPKAFHKYFQSKVDEFLRDKGRIKLESGSTAVQRHLKVSYSETSPAVTLEYKSVNNIPYSIDLVPAIEFDHFPEPTRDWACSWIPERNVTEIRQTFHVVAKIQQTELVKAPGQCRLWRLSFSAAEKKLLVSADGKHAPGLTTCRKDVLRLLKLDLADFYETRKDEPHEFPSYYLKMLMLNLFEKQPESKDWEKDKTLLARYTDALRYWKTSISERQLPHYFIAGENMLLEEGRPKSQLRALEQWVSECMGKYVIPGASSAALHNSEC